VALLLLGQREKLEAGEERGKTGQVTIVVWVRLCVAAADDSPDLSNCQKQGVRLAERPVLSEPVSGPEFPC